MQRDLARIATLEDDGWALEDAEERYAHGEGLFWLPPRWERDQLESGLEEGLCAKLIFRISDPTTEGSNEIAIERMWVKVASREGDFYYGHLDNEPYTTEGRAYEGMPVWFRAEHVIDYVRGEGKPASHSSKTLECCTHGLSEACFVCEHLVGATGAGFHTANDPERLRPDAWCDKCEKLVQKVGGDWDLLGDRHPKLAILCGGCYDQAREDNEHRSLATSSGNWKSRWLTWLRN